MTYVVKSLRIFCALITGFLIGFAFVKKTFLFNTKVINEFMKIIQILKRGKNL